MKIFLLLTVQLAFVIAEPAFDNERIGTENSILAKYRIIETNSSLAKCPYSSYSDLYIITHTSSDIERFIPDEYGYFPVDLNKGAKGKHIYLAARRSCNYALNFKLHVWSGSQRPGSSAFPISSVIPNSQGYRWPGADLNEGAGGNYIYAWFTRESGYYLHDIYVMTANYGSAKCDNGYIKSADLNGGCGSSTPYIHFCYRH